MFPGMFGPHEPKKEPSPFDPANARHEIAPDLRTQLESLLDEAWNGEAQWRFFDQNEVAVRQYEFEERRKGNGGRKKESSTEADAQSQREETGTGRTDEEKPSEPIQ